MNAYAITQLEFKEGFFFQGGHRYLRLPHIQISLTKKKYNNNNHSHHLFNVYHGLGLVPSSFLKNTVIQPYHRDDETEPYHRDDETEACPTVKSINLTSWDLSSESL